MKLYALMPDDQGTKICSSPDRYAAHRQRCCSYDPAELHYEVEVVKRWPVAIDRPVLRERVSHIIIDAHTTNYHKHILDRNPVSQRGRQDNKTAAASNRASHSRRRSKYSPGRLPLYSLRLNFA